MPHMQVRTRVAGRRALLLAGAGLAMLALAARPAAASPNYVFAGTIAIPPAASNTAGTFTGYDLSTFDASTQLYYLTDRSNNGIDVFSAKTNTYVERIGAGLFSGTQGGNNDIAGPNGIGISNVGAGKLLVTSNGTSTVQTFNLAADGLTVLSTPPSVSTAVAGTPTPSTRVDGVAYAPTANTILAANNASNPGFVTLINNADGSVIKSILLNGTNGYPNVRGDGVEATIFNTARGTFFVAVPVFNGSGSGGVIELDARTGALLNTYDFNALGLTGSCSPTGVAQGSGASMLVACSDPSNGVQSVLLDPTGIGSIKQVAGISGGDQVAYDPTRNVFFEAARFQPGGPTLGVIDGATGLLTQTLPITGNDHSVAVDPVSGEVFVAFGAGVGAGLPNPYCAATGCIGVFAVQVQVPEPASLPLMGLAIAAFGLVTLRRRA